MFSKILRVNTIFSVMSKYTNPNDVVLLASAFSVGAKDVRRCFLRRPNENKKEFLLAKVRTCKKLKEWYKSLIVHLNKEETKKYFDERSNIQNKKSI